MTVEEAIEIIERKCGVQSDTLSCAAMILVARIKELEAANAVLELDRDLALQRAVALEESRRELPTPPEVTG